MMNIIKRDVFNVDRSEKYNREKQAGISFVNQELTKATCFPVLIFCSDLGSDYNVIWEIVSLIKDAGWIVKFHEEAKLQYFFYVYNGT